MIVFYQLVRQKMQDYLNFISQYQLLVGAFLLFLVGVIYIEKKNSPIQISLPQAVNMINQENTVILDVRKTDDYKKGFIKNAIHIEMANIKSAEDKLRPYKKDKSIIVVCNSGAVAKSAAKILQNIDFKASVLTGGMTAWMDAQYPIKKHI